MIVPRVVDWTDDMFLAAQGKDVIYNSPGGGAGCCLHILLDDSNIEDHNIDFCIGWAKAHGHDRCIGVAHLFRMLTVDERATVLGMVWCDVEGHGWSCCDSCHECQEAERLRENAERV